jgi:RimJ/RimL family protein N-acetyltransferase
VLKVFKSNPRYLAWDQGEDYDLEALRGDWESARTTRGRNMMAITDRSTGELVGVIEYLEVNPNDGHPWIGLIMTTAERQREGLAREAMDAVCRQVNLNWASPVRMAVIDQNEAGLGLAESLGFESYGEAWQDLGSGEQRLVLLERRM